MGQIPEEREMSWLDGWLDAVREGPYGKGDQEAVRIIEKLMKAEQRALDVEEENADLVLRLQQSQSELHAKHRAWEEADRRAESNRRKLKDAEQERDTARQEAAKMQEALQCIMNTPPDYRPTHKGENERKAWQIIDEMKSQAHEALHSSDAPASEPEKCPHCSRLLLPVDGVPYCEHCDYSATDPTPADRPQEQPQGGGYKLVPAEPTLEWAERLLEIPAADGHAEATYMIEKVIETAPVVGAAYAMNDAGGWTPIQVTYEDDSTPADRREDGEKCDSCGCRYQAIYRVPDDVWRQIHPKESEFGGLLCMECAWNRAKERGITLYFEAFCGWWPEARPEPSEALEDFKFVEALAYQGASSMSFGKLQAKAENIRHTISQPAPAVPQTDAQREALEKLNDLKERAERGEDPERGELCASQEDADTVRQYILSQSGQAVPSAVRRLLTEMRQDAKARREHAESLHGMDEECSMRHSEADLLDVYADSFECALADAAQPSESPAVPDSVRRILESAEMLSKVSTDPVAKDIHTRYRDELRAVIAAAPDAASKDAYPTGGEHD